jgi:hypothetical protein
MRMLNITKCNDGVFIWGELGHLGHAMRQGRLNQDALQHKSNNGWFDEGLREIVGHSTK